MLLYWIRGSLLLPAYFWMRACGDALLLALPVRAPLDSHD